MRTISTYVEIELSEIMSDVKTKDLIEELRDRAKHGDSAAAAAVSAPVGGTERSVLDDRLDEIERAAAEDRNHFLILMNRLRVRLMPEAPQRGLAS